MYPQEGQKEMFRKIWDWLTQTLESRKPAKSKINGTRPRPHVKLTRREALAGAVATALGGAGIYELVDRLGGSAPKRATA